MKPPLKAVLFDFDGTFADTAGDLGGALNLLRAEHSLEPLPIETTRPYCTFGARSLVGLGFNKKPGDESYEALRVRFLDLYASRLVEYTRPFDGMIDTVRALESKGLTWGIVTNKAERFTMPILQGLHLQPPVVVCGDTAARAKPHPDPLLLAAVRLGIAPQACAYVGDALTDMQAAVAAGMQGWVALYGYIPPDSDARAWPAQAWLKAPSDLIGLI